MQFLLSFPLILSLFSFSLLVVVTDGRSHDLTQRARALQTLSRAPVNSATRPSHAAVIKHRIKDLDLSRSSHNAKHPPAPSGGKDPEELLRLKKDYLEPLAPVLRLEIDALKGKYPEGVDRPTPIEVPLPSLKTLPMPRLSVVPLPSLEEVPLPDVKVVPMPSLKEVPYQHPIEYYYAQVRQAHMDKVANNVRPTKDYEHGHPVEKR